MNIKKLSLLAIGFVLIISCDPKEKNESDAEVEENQPDITVSADEFNLSLKGVGVADTNLQDAKGKVVFINYWATWCPPCKEEMPSIEALYQAKKDQMEFFLIGGFKENTNQLNAYVKQKGLKAPVYMSDGLIPNKIKPGEGIPTTYILNKKGEVALRLVGGADWNSPEIHQLVDSLHQQAL